MHTYTLYDSAYTHKNPNLSPVHHLRCDLNMHEMSIQMLKDNKVIGNIDKFPTKLHCVLTEIPEISFDSTWGTGNTATAFIPITNFLDGPIGNAIQVVAGKNNIPLVPTNEYSQQVLKQTTRPVLNLKFTVYTDTYNKRYNFTSSPYETWVKMLYFSTAPIYKASFANVFNMIKSAANGIADNSENISKLFETIKDGGAALMNSLPVFETDSKESAKNLTQVAANIDELQRVIMQYLTDANRIGHVCWDVVIPQYLHTTDKTTAPVLWNVLNFNVTFSDKFTRGLVTDKSIHEYRPRPLYANFNVVLQANQEMTRDQYIKLLFGNVYDELLSKKS